MKSMNHKTPKRGKVDGLTDAKIRKTFEMLGLQHLNRTQYKGDAAFFRQFERCTVLRETGVSYAAHTGM